MNGIDPEQHRQFFVDRLRDACFDRQPLPDRESDVWTSTAQLGFSPVYTLVNKLKNERSVKIYRGLIPFRFQCLRVQCFVEYANFLTRQLGHKKFDIKAKIQREASILQPVIESGDFPRGEVREAWWKLFELIELKKPENDTFTQGLTMYHKFDDLYEKAKLTEPIFSSSQSPRKKRKPAEEKTTSARAAGSLETWIR